MGMRMEGGRGRLRREGLCGELGSKERKMVVYVRGSGCIGTVERIGWLSWSCGGRE